MQSKPITDEILPYPILQHATRWAGCPLSEEYVVPPEDKTKLLLALYPFDKIPGMDVPLMDIHENKVFVVRDFKVVREEGMNMLVSPYYYRSGGSVIDWCPVGPPEEEDEDEDASDDGSGVFLFGGPMVAVSVREGYQDRLVGLIERQHEGVGL